MKKSNFKKPILKNLAFLFLFMTACVSDKAPEVEPTPVVGCESLGEISFSATIGPIIEENCSECHDGGHLPLLLNYDQIAEVADNVKAQTSAGLMPPPGDAPPLTDQQIELIGCWVDNGAPNN